MAVMEADIEHVDQFQIGDEVVYLPEQVITTVSGYVWTAAGFGPPRILLYELACGINVPKNLLAAYIGGR